MKSLHLSWIGLYLTELFISHRFFFFVSGEGEFFPWDTLWDGCRWNVMGWHGDKKFLIYCFTITFGYTSTAWMLPSIYMNFQFAKLQISIWQLNYRFSYFLCSDNLNIWARGDIEVRNWMLVTLRGYRVSLVHPNISMHILHTVLYTFP